MNPSHRCGAIAIVGRPNVGKSSLLNRLVGADVAITSRKAQTTRHRLLGIRSTEAHQMVFIDTPGMQSEHKAALNRQLNRAALGALAEANAILWVLDIHRFMPEDAAVLQRLPRDLPVVVALNKQDTLRSERDRAEAFALAQRLAAERPWSALVPVSAVSGFQLDALVGALEAELPEAPPMYGPDELTDRSSRFLVAEIVREQVFRLTGDEIPYSATVVIDRFLEPNPAEGRRGLEVDATIVVARDSQKPMVIGQGGERIRRIGTDARSRIAELLGMEVHLRLWVKVKDNWADDEAMVRSFGYGGD